MTKTDLVQHVTNEAGITTRLAESIVNSILEKIKSELIEGNDVAFTGFGRFSVKQNAERKGVNPQTGEKITIPARKVVKFKVSSKLNEALK